MEPRRECTIPFTKPVGASSNLGQLIDTGQKGGRKGCWKPRRHQQPRHPPVPSLGDCANCLGIGEEHLFETRIPDSSIESGSDPNVHLVLKKRTTESTMEAWRVGSGVERCLLSSRLRTIKEPHALARRGERKNVCPSNSILTATDLLMEGNSLGSSNGRFAHPFDAQSCDFIKSGEPVLESVIGCPARRAKGLTTTSGTGRQTTLPHLVL